MSREQVLMKKTDPNIETTLFPGEWEPVNRAGMNRFLDWNGDGQLYDIDWTENMAYYVQ